MCGHSRLLSSLQPVQSYVCLSGSQFHTQGLNGRSCCSPKPASPLPRSGLLVRYQKPEVPSKVCPRLKDQLGEVSKSFSQKNIGCPYFADGIFLPRWALWPLATRLGLTTRRGRGAEAMGLMMEEVTALFSPNSLDHSRRTQQ